MQRYTPEQRQLYADHLCSLIRHWIGDDANELEIDLKRGVEWRPELGSGERRPRMNESVTLTITINGGAHDTEGKPILPAPPVFRGPDAPSEG